MRERLDILVNNAGTTADGLIVRVLDAELNRPIDTEMTAFLSEKNREEALQQIPLGRMGRPEEVATAVAFLTARRPAPGSITGQVLRVNGGRYI